MIRQRLKDIDIKITELSNYLQITRPTLYKYIESYDTNDKKAIANDDVLKFFDYISKNTLAGKKTVLNYILSNFYEEKELKADSSKPIFNSIHKLIQNDPNDNKIRLINIMASKKTFNDVVEYLILVDSLINKKKLTSEEQNILKPYNDLLKIIETEKK